MKLTEGKIVVGAAGRATEILSQLEPGDTPDFAATVAMWFLHCPNQSPAWSHFHLAVIHLRPIDGVKAATITRDGATHEVILAALNPAKKPEPTNLESWSYLRPINFVGQLTLPSDDAARECLHHLAWAVTEGMLWAEPPLSGQLEPWQSQLRQLEDHAAGKHFQ